MIKQLLSVSKYIDSLFMIFNHQFYPLKVGENEYIEIMSFNFAKSDTSQI